MDDWDRIAGICFFTLAGVSLACVLLVLVARARRSDRRASLATAASRWLPFLSAVGAGLFILMSIQDEVAFLGLGPVVVFAWVVVRPAPEGQAPQGDARLFAFLAAVAWIAASVTQYATAQWSKTVNGPIRADLLLTGPTLAFCTWVAVSAISQARMSPGTNPANF